MTKSLWSKLILPLALVAASLLALHYRWDSDGLLINLTTEVVGIVVTVAYVDWVIRRHEANRWHGTNTRIADRLKVYVNAVISGIRTGLGFGPDVMDQAEVMSGDLERAHLEVLRVAEHVLEPASRARVAELDEEGWRRLANHLQSMWAEAERLLDRFPQRLEPRQVELLLDLQTTIISTLVFWRTFPDLAGVPADRLPETKTPPEILQSLGYDSTAKELRRVLALARDLAKA